jgi:hypothetical protein
VLLRVELRTTVLPPIAVSDDTFTGGGGAGGGGGGGPSLPSPRRLLLGLLRPAVTVETPVGATTKAPAGEPGEAWRLGLPVFALVVLGVLALAVYGAWCLARKA